MLESPRSPVKPDPPPFPVLAGTGPTAEPMSVTATVTDVSGDPILTVTLIVEPVGSDEPPTVVAEGDVDLDTAPLLGAALITAVDGNPHVRCDLRRVTFFSAAGINALVAGHRRAVENGSRLEVRGAQGITRRLLRLTGLESLLSERP